MAEPSRSARLRRRLGRVVAGSSTTALPAGAERKDKTPGRMLRAKPPNVRGKGPLLDGRGLELAVVAIVKNEAE